MNVRAGVAAVAVLECNTDVGLVGGAHERVTVLRLYCLGRHLRLNVLSSDTVDTRPHRRPVCGSTGGNTASVSLWCANIKAASEPLVTEKKVYLKIKLYPSLSRTEKSTRWPAFPSLHRLDHLLLSDGCRTGSTTETISAEVQRQIRLTSPSSGTHS